MNSVQENHDLIKALIIIYYEKGPVKNKYECVNDQNIIFLISRRFG